MHINFHNLISFPFPGKHGNKISYSLTYSVGFAFDGKRLDTGLFQSLIK